jgi:hypothetical protein
MFITQLLSRSKLFEYQSAPEFVENWLEQGDDFYQFRFNDAYRTLADNIVRSL